MLMFFVSSVLNAWVSTLERVAVYWGAIVLTYTGESLNGINGGTACVVSCGRGYLLVRVRIAWPVCASMWIVHHSCAFGVVLHFMMGCSSVWVGLRLRNQVSLAPPRVSANPEPAQLPRNVQAGRRVGAPLCGSQPSR